MNDGLASLDSSGKVPLSQIPLDGSVIYQGTWNAMTNTPIIVSSVGTKGHYYVVSVSGTTNIDGISSWSSGDHIIFNGVVWEKSDLSDAVSSVNGQTGAVVITAPDITIGVFADARISQTSVTQHESAIDHDSLSNYAIEQHRIINDAGTSATELWSSSRIDFGLSNHVHDASDVTSGTFTNARISQSSVTQHESAIDHNSLLNYVAEQHRIINDAGTSVSELWSASKINTELTTQTHDASDITSGTFADARISQSSITQHEAAINHNLLLNYDIDEHRIINDAGTSTIELWSSSKIDTELSSQTHDASDITSGTFVDARISQSSVTQHEGAIDHQSISGSGTNDHTAIDAFIASKGMNDGLASLDSSGKVPLSQLPLDGSVIYQGTWNAMTNTPIIVSSVGTKGHYYVVSVAGNTTIDGISVWNSGDHIIFNGVVWEKTDLSDAVSSVNGQTGAVVITAPDITIGVFADARITQSSVTQHEASIDHDSLSNYFIDQHRTINDAGTSATELWSSSKINTELTSQTHVASDITSGTFADGRISESSVTQHEGAIDHDLLANYVLDQHRTINDVGVSSVDLWSASKIITELSSQTHDASDTTSGTFDDARISENSVTQHETAIDHNSLLNYAVEQHRIINDAVTSPTELWSSTKISSELSSQTHDTSDIISGVFADARISESSVTQHEGAIDHQSISGSGTNDHTTIDAFIASKGMNNGIASLDPSGKVPLSQIPVDGSVIYQGTWNAMTNTPTIVSSVGTKGHYYVVSVSGTTNIDGISSWNSGDHIIFNGAVWEKMDLSDAVSSVNGQMGVVVITAPDITSGVFADARIAQSSVTQHESAIDHNLLSNYAVEQHRVINDAGTSTTQLWSASKISTELTSQTHAASDITSGTFADARISQSSVTQRP